MLKQVQHDGFFVLPLFFRTVIPNLFRDLKGIGFRSMPFGNSGKKGTFRCWNKFSMTSKRCWNKFSMTGFSHCHYYLAPSSRTCFGIWKEPVFAPCYSATAGKYKSTFRCWNKFSMTRLFMLSLFLHCHSGLVPGSKRNEFTHFSIPGKMKSEKCN